MRITYLLPVVSQARYHKRVGALERLGTQSEILAFERSYYPGKPWPNGYRSLGKLQHGHYLKRLPLLLKAVSTVRTAAQKSDAIYAFGLDMLLIAWLAGRGSGRKRKLVYEVGDIRQILLGNRMMSRLLRWFERSLLRQVDLVVVTSKAYITEYFHGIQGLHTVNYHAIENKLDASEFCVPQDDDSYSRRYFDDTLRIGYFGLIRCPHSWQILRETVKRGGGRIQIYIRGIFMRMDDLEEEIRNTEFVEYGGPFVSPDELPAMYGNVDVVWVAYHPHQGDFRWARANRFYEACYFRRPIIAQIGTQDGRVVEECELGTCIDLFDVEGAVDQLLHISRAQLASWQDHLARLPKHVYVYTDEHEKLLKAIQ